MAVVDVIRVNNQPYSWNSSISLFDLFPSNGVVEVNYSEKLDIETVYSQTQDGRPIGGTAGQYEVDSFTIKMLRDSADAFTTYLSTVPSPLGGPITPGSYGRREFSYSLNVDEPLLPGGLPIILLAGVCRIRGVKETTAKGIEALVTEFDIWCKGITKNGKTLYSSSIPGLGSLL
jgi:hypothetical protein